MIQSDITRAGDVAPGGAVVESPVNSCNSYNSYHSCLYACMYVCMYVYTYIHTYIHNSCNSYS